MSHSTNFEPDWTSAPGETIIDLMDEFEVSIEQLSKSSGLTLAATNKLLRGDIPIDQEIADVLHSLFGPSPEFWLNRQSTFRALEEPVVPSSESEWLSVLPVADMVNLGWIKAGHDAKSKINACKEFFGITAMNELTALESAPRFGAVYRTSQTMSSNPYSVIAWLRQGEKLVEDEVIAEWSPAKLASVLPKLRRLTWQRRPAIFLAQLESILASAGVKFLLVKAPKGCLASGASWQTTSGVYVIQMSFRYLSDDHFWFTLMHEIAHLLYHRDHLPFIETNKNLVNSLEIEANLFAAQTLVPIEHQKKLMMLPASKKDIVNFAKKVGVAPGIIVGQMQHHMIIGFHQMNHLKRRFEWT